MRRLPFPNILLCLACLLLPVQDASALDTRFAGLLTMLEADGLDAGYLRTIFNDPRLAYDSGSMGRKMRALYRRKYVPAKEKPRRTDLTIWDTHLTREKRANILKFQHRNAKILAQAQNKYGVSSKIIVALLAMETELGNFLGDQPALANLASMAVSRDYADLMPYLNDCEVKPKQKEWLLERTEEKADWAYEELKALLEYARQNRFDPLGIQGSIYGAIGLCQFLPSNALRVGVDSDNDGRVDLFHVSDAVYSVGNFLKDAGWKDSLSYKRKVRVLKRYNPDTFYAQVVLAIAKRI